MNKIMEWIARKVPKRFLYWMVIRAWAICSTEKYTDKEPDEISWCMVCNYLENHQRE